MNPDEKFEIFISVCAAFFHHKFQEIFFRDASKGAQRIRGMDTTAPTFTMLKRLYAADAQSRIENRNRNSCVMIP